MLNKKLKKNQLKNGHKNHISQLKSIDQIYDLSH